MSSSSISDVSGIVGIPMSDTTASVVFRSSLIPYIDVQTTRVRGTSDVAVQLEYNWGSTVGDPQRVEFTGLPANTVTTFYSTASGGVTHPTILIPISTPVNGNNTIIMSDDGIRWAYSRQTQLSSAKTVVWNDTHWVATGLGSTGVSGANYITSTDGIYWKNLACPFLSQINDVSFDDYGMGVAVGVPVIGSTGPYSMSVLMKGQVWFPVLGSQQLLNTATRVLKTTKWIAVGSIDIGQYASAFVGNIIESYNGIDWATAYTSNGGEITAIDWNPVTNIHIAVGGTVLLSRNAAGIWFDITPTGLGSFNDVKFNGTTWVLTSTIGGSSSIYTSEDDGASWNQASQSPGGSSSTTGFTITNLYWDGLYWNAVLSNGYISVSQNGSSWADKDALPVYLVGNGYATKLLKPNVSRPIANDVDPFPFDVSLSGLTSGYPSALENINDLVLPLAPLTTVASNIQYISTNFLFNGVIAPPTFSSQNHSTFSLSFQADEYLTKYINFESEDGQKFGMKLSNKTIQFTTNTLQKSIPQTFSRNGMDYAYLYRLLPIYSIEKNALQTLNNSVKNLITDAVVPILNIIGNETLSLPEWFDISKTETYQNQVLQFYSPTFDNKTLFWDYNIQPIVDTYNFISIDDSLFTTLDLQNTNFPTLTIELSKQYEKQKEIYFKQFAKETALSEWLLTNYNSNSGVTGSSFQEKIALAYNTAPDDICVKFGSLKTSDLRLLKNNNDYAYNIIKSICPSATINFETVEPLQPLIVLPAIGEFEYETSFYGSGMSIYLNKQRTKLSELTELTSLFNENNGLIIVKNTDSLRINYFLPLSSFGIGNSSAYESIGERGFRYRSLGGYAAISNTQTTVTYVDPTSTDILFDTTLSSVLKNTPGGKSLENIMKYSKTLSQIEDTLKNKKYKIETIQSGFPDREANALFVNPIQGRQQGFLGRQLQTGIIGKVGEIDYVFKSSDTPSTGFIDGAYSGILDYQPYTALRSAKNVKTDIYKNYGEFSSTFVQTAKSLLTLESFITNRSEYILESLRVSQQQINDYNSLISNATLSVNMYNNIVSRKIENQINSLVQNTPDSASVLTNISYTSNSNLNVSYDGQFLRFYVDQVLVKQFSVLNNSNISFSMNFGDLVSNITTGISGVDWNNTLMNPNLMQKTGVDIFSVNGFLKNISLNSIDFNSLLQVINDTYKVKSPIVPLSDFQNSRSIEVSMIPVSDSVSTIPPIQTPIIPLDYYNTVLRFTSNPDLIKYCGTKIKNITLGNPYLPEDAIALTLFTSYITNEITIFKGLLNTLKDKENLAYSNYLSGLTSTVPQNNTSYGYESSQKIVPYFIEHLEFQTSVSNILSTVDGYSPRITTDDIIFLLEKYQEYAPLYITYTNAIEIYVTTPIETLTVLNPFVKSRNTKIGRRTVVLGNDGSTGDTVQSRYPLIPDRHLTKSVTKSFNNAFNLYSIQNVGNTGPTGTINRVSSSLLTPYLNNANTGYTGASGSFQDWFNLLERITNDINGVKASYSFARLYINALLTFDIEKIATLIISQKSSDFEFARNYLNDMYSTTQVKMCISPSDNSGIANQLAWDYYYGMTGSSFNISSTETIARRATINYSVSLVGTVIPAQVLEIRDSQRENEFIDFNIGELYSKFLVPSQGRVSGTIIGILYELTNYGRDAVLTVSYPPFNTSPKINYKIPTRYTDSYFAQSESLRFMLKPYTFNTAENGDIIGTVVETSVSSEIITQSTAVRGIEYFFINLTISPTTYSIIKTDSVIQFYGNYETIEIGSSWKDGTVISVSYSYLSNINSKSLDYKTYIGLADKFQSNNITLIPGQIKITNPSPENKVTFQNIFPIKVPDYVSYKLFPYTSTVEANTGNTGSIGFRYVNVASNFRPDPEVYYSEYQSYSTNIAPFDFSEIGHTFGNNVLELAPKLSSISWCDPEFPDVFMKYFNTNIGLNSYPEALSTNYTKYTPLENMQGSFSFNNSFIGKMSFAKLYGGDIIFSPNQYADELVKYINSFNEYSAFTIPELLVNSTIYNIQYNLTSLLTNYFNTFRISQNNFYYFSQETEQLYTTYIEDFNNQSLAGYTGTSYNSLYTQIVAAQNSYITSQISSLPTNGALFTDPDTVLSTFTNFKLGLVPYPEQIATVQTSANKYILGGFKSTFNAWLTTINIYENVIDSQLRFNAISDSVESLPPPRVVVSDSSAFNFIVNILPIDTQRWCVGLTGISEITDPTVLAQMNDQYIYNRFNPVWRYFKGDVVSYKGQIYTCINTERQTKIKNAPPEPFNSIVLWSEFHDLPVTEPLISHPLEDVDGPIGSEVPASKKIYDPTSVEPIPSEVTYLNSYYKSNFTIDTVKKLFGETSEYPQSFNSSPYWKTIGPYSQIAFEPGSHGVWLKQEKLNMKDVPETNLVSVLTGTGSQYGYYQSLPAKNHLNEYLLLKEYTDDGIYEIGDHVTYEGAIYTRLANGITALNGSNVMIKGIPPPSARTRVRDLAWLAKPYIELNAVYQNVRAWSDLTSYTYGDFVIYKNLVYEFIAPIGYPTYNPQESYLVGVPILYESYIFESRLPGSLPPPPKITTSQSQVWWYLNTLETPAGGGRALIPATRVPKVEIFNPIETYQAGDLVIQDGFLIQLNKTIDSRSGVVSNVNIKATLSYAQASGLFSFPIPEDVHSSVSWNLVIGADGHEYVERKTTMFDQDYFSVNKFTSSSTTRTTDLLTAVFMIPKGTWFTCRVAGREIFFQTSRIYTTTISFPINKDGKITTTGYYDDRVITYPPNTIPILNSSDYPSNTNKTSENWKLVSNYFSANCKIQNTAYFDPKFDYLSNTSFYNKIYKVEHNNAIWLYIKCINLNAIHPPLPEPYTNWKCVSAPPNLDIPIYSPDKEYITGDFVKYKNFVFVCICQSGFGYSVDKFMNAIPVTTYKVERVTSSGLIHDPGNGNVLMTTVMPGNDEDSQAKWGSGELNDPWAIDGFARNIRKSFAESLELAYLMYKHDLKVIYGSKPLTGAIDAINNMVYPQYRLMTAPQAFTTIGLANTDAALEGEITRITKRYAKLEFYYYSKILKCMTDSLTAIQYWQSKYNDLCHSWFLDNWAGTKEIWRSNLQYNPPVPTVDGNTMETPNMDLAQFPYFGKVTLTKVYETNLLNLWNALNDLPVPNDILNIYRQAAGCSKKKDVQEGTYISMYNTDYRSPLSSTGFADFFNRNAIDGSSEGLADISYCSKNIESYIHQSRTIQTSIDILVDYVQSLTGYQYVAAQFKNRAMITHPEALYSQKLLIKTGTDEYMAVPIFTMADRDILNYNTDTVFNPPVGLTGPANPNWNGTVGNPDYISLTEPTATTTLPLLFQYRDLLTAYQTVVGFTDQQFLADFRQAGLSYPGSTITRDEIAWPTLTAANLIKYQNKRPISSVCSTPEDCTPGTTITYFYKNIIAYTQLAELFQILPPTYCYTKARYYSPYLRDIGVDGGMNTTAGFVQSHINVAQRAQEEAKKQALIVSICMAVACAAISFVAPGVGALVMGAVTIVQTVGGVLPSVDALQIFTDPYGATTGQAATQAGLLRRCTAYETVLGLMASTPQPDAITTSVDPFIVYDKVTYYEYKYAQQFLKELNTVEIPRLMKNYTHSLTESSVLDILGSTSGINLYMTYPTEPTKEDLINQPGNFGLAMARSYASIAESIIALYETEVLIPPYIRPPSLPRPAVFRVLGIYVKNDLQDPEVFRRNPENAVILQGEALYLQDKKSREARPSLFSESPSMLLPGSQRAARAPVPKPPNFPKFYELKTTKYYNFVTDPVSHRMVSGYPSLLQIIDSGEGHRPFNHYLVATTSQYNLTTDTNYNQGTGYFGIQDYTTRYVNERSIIGIDSISMLGYSNQVNQTSFYGGLSRGNGDARARIGDLLYFDPQKQRGGGITSGSTIHAGVSISTRASTAPQTQFKWTVDMGNTNRIGENGRFIQSGGQGTAPSKVTVQRQVSGTRFRPVDKIPPKPQPLPQPISKPTLSGSGLKPTIRPIAEVIPDQSFGKISGRMIPITPKVNPAAIADVVIPGPPSYPAPLPDPLPITAPKPVPPARIATIKPNPIASVRQIPNRPVLTRGVAFRNMSSAIGDGEMLVSHRSTPAPSKISRVGGAAMMLISGIITSLTLPLLPNDCKGILAEQG